MFRVITVFLFFLLAGILYGQEKYPQNYFQKPMDVPLLLAGNFAELRSNHFHSGIDIRTNGKIGVPVKASADGRVARINVSPFGFGHVLYVEHPNGFTTVYAHLNRFNSAIAQWVKEHQYKKEAFTVELFPKKDEFVVKKGEIIGYSGNSGSSGGPHLHFEIRNTSNQHPLNPLLFGFKVLDDMRPRVYSASIFSADDDRNNFFPTRKYSCVFYSGKFHLRKNPVVTVNGDFGVTIHANDFLNKSWAKCGVYRMQVLLDGSVKYSFKLNEFSFAESRYINSHIDYSMYHHKRVKAHRCVIDDGNVLSIYNREDGNGILRLHDNKIHRVTVNLWDVSGNKSVLSFKVKNGAKVKPLEVPEHVVQKVEWEKPIHFKSDAIQCDIPAKALYKNRPFTYWQETDSTELSDVHHILKDDIPTHKYYDLKMNPQYADSVDNDKLLLAKKDLKTGRLWAMGGNYKDGWVEAKVRSFGSFVVACDTIAPKIRSLSIKNHKTLMHRNSISFVIKDEFSGIKKYRGEIDGKWVLFEYDAKKSTIRYKFDKKRFTFKRRHQLKLEVEDIKGNIASYEASFYK
ncbi:M23 family metallopeptidase [Prolixibacteraceae bacterium JC049]|nr:M23 family metallopeptidase [Prolixibacteraceae bacterium JC049]